MKSRELKQVGQVAIDSGRILIMDESHFSPKGCLPPADCFHAQNTKQGDGTYPVFEFVEDGHTYLAVRTSIFSRAELCEMFGRGADDTQEQPQG